MQMIEPKKVPNPGISAIYLIYWTIASLFAGMLLGPLVLPEHPEGVRVHQVPLSTAGRPIAEPDHVHELLDIPPELAPSVALAVERDAVSGWNLTVLTEGFQFALTDIAASGFSGEGHGHLYVGSEKVARLYGPNFHLSDLQPGPHVLRVTLNTHAHDTLAVAGRPIFAEVQINQP